MDVKRNNKVVKKLASMDTFSIKQKGGATFIEGFANKATLDRGDEIIATNAWELDNFKKNPVILFNHGFDTLGGTPVGTATQVKETDEGLFLKVRLSNSEAPGIRMVRDLVEEKILQAFSVGFDPKETEKSQIGEGEDVKEITRITKAELFEVSIVGVPMNQDSLFTVSEKSLTTKSLYEIKKEVLEQKGAEFAQKTHEQIHMLEAQGQDRLDLTEMLAEAASITNDEVKDILAGNVEPTDDFKAAVAAIFKDEGKNEEKADEEPKDEDDESPEDEDDKEEKGKDGEDEEGEDAGDDKEEDEEDPDKKSEESEDDEDEDDVDSTKQDFEDCVSSKVPALVNEGMEQDQAVAVAVSECQESGKCTLSPESKSEVFSVCFDAMEAFKETGEWDFSKLQEAVTLNVDATEVKQAEQEGDDGVTVPIKTAPDEDNFGSPFLEAQKQTNVMMGVLIGEIQKLSQIIADMGQKNDTLSTDSEDNESEKVENSEEDEPVSDKTIARAQKSLDNLSKRLNNLGC